MPSLRAIRLTVLGVSVLLFFGLLSARNRVTTPAEDPELSALRSELAARSTCAYIALAVADGSHCCTCVPCPLPVLSQTSAPWRGK